MKKSMFALACAVSVAAFAEQTIGTTIGFEDYTLPFKGLSFKDDAGGSTGSFYWLYQGAAGAEDGSEVKAYDSSSTEFGANFLELSTEGGTLWRSVAPLADEALNAGTAIPDGGLYVDTMVQFTPTEDGGAPELAAGDKLAIWLNVETPEGATSPVTNLCVRAGAVSRAGMEVVTPTTFVLAGTGGIEAGKWYRLTVTAIKDVTKAVEFGEKPRGVTGFSIKLDGEELSTTSTVFDDSYIDYADWLLDSEVALLQSGKVFASLEGFVTTAQLSAVGFKGSGAIDNLTISDEDPTPAPVVEIDLSITAANATVTGIAAGKVKAGDALSFTVAAAEGYTVTGVTINGNAATAVEGTYSYTVAAEDEAVAVVVTTEAIPSVDWDHPQAQSGTAAEMFGLTGDLGAVNGKKLATWAKGVGNVSFDNASSIDLEAFLLNCANTTDAITAAKATFTIVSIEQDAEGNWVVTVTGGKGNGADYGNGTIEIQGATTLEGPWAKDTADAKFFKAVLK